MNLGVVFPQTEFGHDPAALRDFAQTAESLGFSHIVAYDHVLGANPNRPGGWSGPYTHQSSFLEPFVLFGWMAAVTEHIGLAPSVIILPQRQTALVAKQAATLDVLSAGRLRLGIGLGWNEVEYQALGQDFRNRGARIEEQVELLRALWTAPPGDLSRSLARGRRCRPESAPAAAVRFPCGSAGWRPRLSDAWPGWPTAG